MTLKKLILFSFIFTIVFSCTSFAENPQEKEWSAINKYQELMNSFESTRTSDDYPDYYCGAYINDQKDFVVLVKEDTDKAEISRLIDDSDVIIKTADYSYNELENLYDELNTKIDFLEKNDPEMVSLINDITTFGIYDDENRIIVTILDVNDQKIKQFKEKISDSNAIVFEKGTPMTADFSVGLGSTIAVVTEKAILNGSAGFRCQRIVNGTAYNGFVIAGHGLPDGNLLVRDSSQNTIGSINGKQFSGSVDAAFVNASNCTIDSTACNGATIKGNHYTTSYPRGATVVSCGLGTSSTGTIKSSSVTVNLGIYGVRISDCVKTSCTIKPGWSGGLVYMNVNGDNVPTGINSCDDDSASYYCKVSNIVNGLGVTPY